MKKIYLLLLFTLWVSAVFLFLLPSETKQIYDLTKKEKISTKIANDIFIPSNINNKVLFFLDQIKKKNSHFRSYDIRLTQKNVFTTSEDWRFFGENLDQIGPIRITIQISEGTYKFFSEYLLNRNLTLPLSVGSGKGLYDCLNNCFEGINYESLERAPRCDCTTWFSSPNLINYEKKNF